MVEHDLAKVGVASSSLVSRSSFMLCWFHQCSTPSEAGWQSGHAADCKSVNAGSIPTSASIIQNVWYVVPASPDGETGRRKGLKIPRRQLRAGSIPAPGTITHIASLKRYSYSPFLASRSPAPIGTDFFASLFQVPTTAGQRCASSVRIFAPATNDRAAKSIPVPRIDIHQGWSNLPLVA